MTQLILKFIINRLISVYLQKKINSIVSYFNIKITESIINVIITKVILFHLQNKKTSIIHYFNFNKRSIISLLEDLFNILDIITIPSR